MAESKYWRYHRILLGPFATQFGPDAHLVVWPVPVAPPRARSRSLSRTQRRVKNFACLSYHPYTILVSPEVGILAVYRTLEALE